MRSNLFDFSEAISESFSWHFLGIYLSFVFFAGLGIWSIVQLIRYHKGSSLLTDSELRLDTLKTARQNIKQIQEQYDDIPVHMLRQILNLDSEADLETLRQLLPPELQYTIIGNDVVFLKETVSKIIGPTTLITATRKDACFFCQAPISLDAEKCPKCGKEILDCAICKLPIKPSEEVAQCPKCEYIFHFKHLKTWVEFKMKCPTCLRELLPSEVQLDNPDK